MNGTIKTKDLKFLYKRFGIWGVIFVLALLLIISAFIPAGTAKLGDDLQEVLGSKDSEGENDGEDGTDGIQRLEGMFTVERVVDGDTLVIETDHGQEKVRLIGVDTPESVDPRKEVECFGREAANALRELVEGKKVQIEADSTQDDRDRYDRLLRYIYLPSGSAAESTNVNGYLIAKGYAYEYTYSSAYRFQSQFKLAQKIAEENELGLWSPSSGCVQ